MFVRPIPLMLSFACLALPFRAVGEDKITPGELIVEPPTLICLGFEWYLEGDANRNATVRVRYRAQGTAAWSEALPLLRIGGERPGLWPNPEPLEQMFAGSILDLAPDTQYEVRLEMSDPDGVTGQTLRTVTARTRREPRAFSGGGTRHVYPKDWKGPKQKPAYNGLIHAYYGYKQFADWIFSLDLVQPGDLILVHGGEYKADRYDYRDYHGLTFHGTYSLTRDGTEDKPIVIRGAGDGEAVFDGDGAYRLFDVSAADYNYFEKLTIRNAEIAFYAGEKDVNGSTGVAVRNCRIENVGIGFMGQNADSKFFYIADNIITGRMPRDHLRSNGQVLNAAGVKYHKTESYFGVKVYGQGHTICHNYVAYFFDGIDVCTHGPAEKERERKAVAIDIYNNDVFVADDNFIETDGGVHNIRVLRNRGFNCDQIGYSFQPVLGGPAYLIRNIGYQLGQHTALKFGNPAGLLIYHNTFSATPTPSKATVWNAHLKNNLFLGPAESDLPVIALKSATSYTTMDYNGHRMVRTKGDRFFFLGPPDGVLQDPELKGPPRLFATWKEFRQGTGLEQHGVLLDYSVFENVPEPDLQVQKGQEGDYYRVITPAGIDFGLKAGSAAIDAGIRLPNVNDDFTGASPDLGALERGRPVPVYGPRTK